MLFFWGFPFYIAMFHFDWVTTLLKQSGVEIFAGFQYTPSRWRSKIDGIAPNHRPWGEIFVTFHGPLNALIGLCGGVSHPSKCFCLCICKHPYEKYPMKTTAATAQVFKISANMYSRPKWSTGLTNHQPGSRKPRPAPSHEGAQFKLGCHNF